MNKTLEQQLIQKYPTIFTDMYGDEMKTCMHWGIECGDGWYNIIDHTCRAIESQCNYFRSKGWTIQFKASQIKEKFGSLRFYYDLDVSDHENDDLTTISICPIDGIINGIITMAELMTSTTCEQCGDQGKMTTGGWMSVRCPQHTKQE